MSNTRIWDALSKTDPKHTKPFKRAGGFSGTAMRPIWTIRRMTEQFGPAGLGWGMGEPTFQTVNAGDEILVFCTVKLWYQEGEGTKHGVRYEVYGVGGDKVLGKNKYGPYTNDEAFKASYTDALSNAMKQIGVGADIHMGLFDDEKYVRETERDFAKKEWQDDPDVQALAPKDAHRDANGKLASNYDAKAAKAAQEWADAAIQSINLGANPETAVAWRRAAATIPQGKKKSPLVWLHDNSPGQWLRVSQAYENATGEVLEA